MKLITFAFDFKPGAGNWLRILRAQAVWVVALGFCMSAHAHPDHAVKDLRVEGAWLRAMPPVQTATAGYFTLYNDSASAKTLVGASSGIAEQVEMHRHVHLDGVARMRPAGDIELPPGGQIEFAPGAYHLMLMGMIRPLTVGDRAMLNLEFADGSRLEVRFPVRERADD